MATAIPKGQQHYLDDHRDVFEGVLAEELSRNGVAMFQLDNGLHYFIHPSSKGYRWQITAYNGTGVINDTQHRSLDDMYPIIGNGIAVPYESIESRLQLFVRSEIEHHKHLPEYAMVSKPPSQHSS